MYLVTTASDDTADNRYAEKSAEMWRAWGADVTTHQFDDSLGVPHNSIDLTTDPDKKPIVYAKILELLGEAP